MQQLHGADCVQFSRSVLTHCFSDGAVGMVAVFCGVSLLECEDFASQEAMAEMDQERFLGNWNTSWNERGTLWNSTAAPGTIGWKQMNCCLNFLDVI